MVTIRSSVKSSRPARFVFVEGAPPLAGFLEGVLGKDVRQAESADDRQRIDARLAARAEHLGDDAFAAIVRRREAQHLDDDLVVGLGPLGAGIADEDAVGEDGAVDADEALAVALEIGADELVGGPLQHPDDVAGGAAIGPARLADDAHHDGVAGGGVVGVAFGDEDFRADVAVDDVRAHKAVAAVGAAKDAGDGAVRRRRADQVIFAEFDQALFEQRR